jgi:hypothetical protein
MRPIAIFLATVILSASVGCGTNQLNYDPAQHQVCSEDGSQLMQIKVIHGSEFVRLHRIKGVDSRCIDTHEAFASYEVEHRGNMCCFNENGEFFMHPDSSYQIENLTKGDAAPIPVSVP